MGNARMDEKRGRGPPKTTLAIAFLVVLLLSALALGIAGFHLCNKMIHSSLPTDANFAPPLHADLCGSPSQKCSRNGCDEACMLVAEVS